MCTQSKPGGAKVTRLATLRPSTKMASCAVLYQAEGQRLLLQTGVPEYLLHCERRFQEESDRCSQYLDAGTRKPLVLSVERELLEQHTQVRTAMKQLRIVRVWHGATENGA
jgi:hypothetical protein